MRHLVRLLVIAMVILVLSGCEGRHKEDGPRAYIKAGQKVTWITLTAQDKLQSGDCVLYDAWDGRVMVIDDEECRDGGNTNDGKWVGKIIKITE